MQAQSKYANLGSLQTLNSEDMEKIKKALKLNEIFRNIFLVVLIIGFGVAASVFYPFFADRPTDLESYKLPIIIGFAVLFGILIQFLFRKDHEKKTSDLHQGMKIVIEGPLEKKKAQSNGKTTTYYFVVKGERFLVKHNLYKQFSEGDPVEIHVTPTAGYVLYIGGPKSL